jgi:hypothetical protein
MQTAQLTQRSNQSQLRQQSFGGTATLVRMSQFSLIRARGSGDICHVTFATYSAGPRYASMSPQFSGYPSRTYVPQNFCASSDNSSTCHTTTIQALDGAAEIQLNITVFWAVTSCIPPQIHPCFGGTYCLHLQDRNTARSKRQASAAEQPSGIYSKQTPHASCDSQSVRPSDALYFYSTDVQFESRQRRLISWLKCFVVFFSTSRQMPTLYLDYTTTASFQILHNSSVILLFDRL